MTKSNLKDFDNFYADLAQSAYRGRPNLFPYERLTEKEKRILDSGKSLPFNFSQNTESYNNETKETETTLGGRNLPHGGKVYLQPDPDLHEVRRPRVGVDVTNPGLESQEETHFHTYQKGLLTDEKAGFNAYFLTDTPTLNEETTKTYLAIRGSDAVSLKKLNDWLVNDAYFALYDGHIPQAKLATVGMKAKIGG